MIDRHTGNIAMKANVQYDNKVSFLLFAFLQTSFKLTIISVTVRNLETKI